MCFDFFVFGNCWFYSGSYFKVLFSGGVFWVVYCGLGVVGVGMFIIYLVMNYLVVFFGEAFKLQGQLGILIV